MTQGLPTVVNPNPIDNEDLFNSIILGGKKSPGKVTLSGHDRKVNWDVKKGPGITGATVTIKEIPPIEFTATFYLVRDDSQGIDQIAQWHDFVKIINSTVSGSKPKAIDIYHPDLAAQDPPISSVVKSSVGGAVDDGKGGRTYTIKFQEYRPPKKKGGTPTGSKAKPNPDPSDPDYQAKLEIQQLTLQLQNTPYG